MEKAEVNMLPHGIEGFDDSMAASISARQHFPTEPFAVLCKEGNYGWILPIEYAKKVAEANRIEIVELIY